MNPSISLRQREILESIRLNGFLTSREIAQRWRISVGTARRDVDRLSAFDVVRSHGGGMLSTLSPSPLPGGGDRFEDRSLLERAARLVRPGMSIGLCAGAHDVALSSALVHVDRISIVTNSIRAAQALWRIRNLRLIDIQVVLTPGEVNESGQLVGPLCTDWLRSVSFDLTFAASQRERDGTRNSVSQESTEVLGAFRESSNGLVILDELRTSNVEDAARLFSPPNVPRNFAPLKPERRSLGIDA